MNSGRCLRPLQHVRAVALDQGNHPLSYHKRDLAVDIRNLEPLDEHLRGKPRDVRNLQSARESFTDQNVTTATCSRSRL
eukprot:765069-Hanusia_phi.AAC.3